jgi:hypothetical protein
MQSFAYLTEPSNNELMNFEEHNRHMDLVRSRVLSRGCFSRRFNIVDPQLSIQLIPMKIVVEDLVVDKISMPNLC